MGQANYCKLLAFSDDVFRIFDVEAKDEKTLACIERASVGKCKKNPAQAFHPKSLALPVKLEFIFAWALRFGPQKVRELRVSRVREAFGNDKVHKKR